MVTTDFSPSVALFQCTAGILLGKGPAIRHDRPHLFLTTSLYPCIFNPFADLPSFESGLTRMPKAQPSQSSQVHRTVLLVYPPLKLQQRSTQTALHEVWNRLDSARRNIESHLSFLRGLTHGLVPPLEVQVTAKEGDDAPLQDYLATLASPGAARACVCFVSVTPDEPSLNQLDISHFLLIVPARKSASGWMKMTANCVQLDVPLDKLCSVVEDLMLDIAMFHGTPGFVERFSTYEDRLVFAHKLGDFARRHAVTYYGPVGQGVYYVPLASACRRRRGINLLKYLDLWAKFTHETSDVVFEPGTIGSFTVPEAAEFILHTHPKGRQISEQRLLKLLSPLKAGPHLLLRAESKPRFARTARIVQSMLGMRQWKTGRMRIYPFQHETQRAAGMLVPYLSYLSFGIRK
jgi:hypothetical protein